MIDDRKPAGAVKLVPHTPKPLLKRMPWPVCSGCGLVYLKNDVTERAIRRGHWLYSDEKGAK